MTDSVLVDEVSFDVTVSGGGLFSGVLGGVLSIGGSLRNWVVRGTLYRPARAPGCDNSVLLLLHGVSQGGYAWDFQQHPVEYSVARLLAAQGYPVVVIDRLGYPSSDRPPGHSVTAQAHADVAAQIVRALRRGHYGGPALAFRHVGLVGHSFGSEIAELCAGRHGGIDVLVVTAYTHFPSLRAILATGGGLVSTLSADYIYFGGTAADRNTLFYDTAFADAAVTAAETALANLTPSGEILSLVLRPSSAVMGAIAIPVLLVLADRDVLFPVAEGPFELALFASATDRELATVPESGHVLFLHRRWRDAVNLIIEWLGRHPTDLPACSDSTVR